MSFISLCFRNSIKSKNYTLFNVLKQSFTLLSHPKLTYQKSYSNFVVGYKTMSTLETLRFDNLVLRRLPIDPEERIYLRTVNGACFSKVAPTPVENPRTVAYSESAMLLLDLPKKELERKDFAEYFSGNKLLPGAEPAAHCYCGHQFGYFSGQLGDGAAMYLGEIINSKDERWEIQLKGAGLTPYSRSADGRKVLRSSIREFLCSEAMHFLGIPTTRAGACITSDSEVIRDVFYDGHPIKEKCSIILRIAPTFIRFGSFEIFKTMDPITRKCGPSVGRHDILIQMLDYVIEVFYSEIHTAYKDSSEDKYKEFFKEIVLRTARLVAEWQCVGFCHGVLNTDNMSVVGLTLDYGPFGFLDIYDPDHICNASDDGGRYTYSKQPSMCLWNLRKFAEVIEKALPKEVSSPLLDLYEPEFKIHYLNKMRKKLGLLKKALPEDSELVESLLSTMQNTGADFTNVFRCLSLLELPSLPGHKSSFSMLTEKLLAQCYPPCILLDCFKANFDAGNLRILLKLATENAVFASHLADSGLNIGSITSKLEKMQALEELTPDCKRAQDCEMWTEWLQMYKNRLEKEQDKDMDMHLMQLLQQERVKVMNNNNPRFVLRNYVAQNAINKAEKGDYSEVRRVLKLLEHPFDDTELPDINISNESFPQTSTKDEGQSTISESCSKQYVDQISDDLKRSPEWALALKVT